MTGVEQRAEPIEAVITDKLDDDFAQAGRNRRLGAALARYGPARYRPRRWPAAPWRAWPT
jgi:hypothetical protein